MPIYELSCPEHGNHDVLMKHGAPNLCPVCGGPASRLVSMPARTSGSWGDSTSYFDRGLGCVVQNAQHREKIMKARGLAPLSDFSNSTADDYVHRKMTEQAAPASAPVVDPERGRALIEKAQSARRNS